MHRERLAPEPALAPAPARQGAAYDDLAADEVVALLDSLEPSDLEALRRHEAEHQARTVVLDAIDRLLAAPRARE